MIVDFFSLQTTPNMYGMMQQGNMGVQQGNMGVQQGNMGVPQNMAQGSMGMFNQQPNMAQQLQYQQVNIYSNIPW